MSTSIVSSRGPLMVLVMVFLALSPLPAKGQSDPLKLGQEFIKEKRYAEAEQVFREVLKNSPDNLTALYGAAIAVFNLGRAAEAEPLARKAVQVAEKQSQANDAGKTREAEALVLLAVIVAVNRNDREALEIAEKAATIGPNHFDAQFTLGRARFEAGNTPGAVSAFRAAVRLSPGNARALFFLGTALERAGDIEGAISTYRDLTAKHPQSAEGHLGLGTLLLRRPETNDEGIKELARAVALNPKLYEAQLNLGRVLVARGKAAESIEHLTRAAELAPQNPEPHFQLSLAYRKLGNRVKAEQEAARVKKIHEARRSSATQINPD